MFTELELVNACLRSIGNEQVSTLDNPDVDTDMATTTVEEARLEMLSRGWWFNREDLVKMYPSSTTGRLDVPAGVIDYRPDGVSCSRDIVTRSGRFYDVRNRTFDLSDIVSGDGSITFSFIVSIRIEDCPLVSLQYLRQRAITRFMTDLEEDSAKIQMSAQQELRYFALLQQQELRNSRFNVYSSPKVSRVLGSASSVNSFAGAGVPVNILGGSDG